MITICERNREMRADVEVVLRRAEFLDDADRFLLEQVLDRGTPIRQLAVLLGCSPRSVQRRVRRLTERLMSPEVARVLRRSDHWTPVLRAVGLALWVRGWTLHQTAAHLGLTLHEVRKNAEAVRGLVGQPEA